VNKVESMRQEWDARARKDAFYYIASWRKDWDVSAFLISGEEDYERLVRTKLDRVGFSPAGKTMLELGCGVGRMTHAFAARFGHVLAVDVSTQMIDRARQILQKVQNISWIRANGEDLGAVRSESVDFAFSYLVFQHLPNGKAVCGYIRELFRVLKESGICLFQFNGMTKPTMNWKGRLAWKFIDAIWSLHLRGLSRFFARLFGFDPEMAGKTWHGTAVSTQSVIEALNACGGSVLEVQGNDTPMVWCCAKKGVARSDTAAESLRGGSVA
jgi:ubiquinone/menaquinone biosynthesis C-methylase UbiE